MSRFWTTSRMQPGVVALFLTLLLGAVAACSDDPTPSPDAGDTPDVANDVSDTGLADAEEDTGQEPDASEPGPCGHVVELGELTGGTRTLPIDFGRGLDLLTTSCAEARADAPEVVYAFSVPEAGFFKVSSNHPVATELRTAPCERDDQALFCSTDGIVSTLDAVPRLYLVVEPLEGTTPDQVELDMSFYPASPCDTPGATRCIDDELVERCEPTDDGSPHVSRLTVLPCPAGCEDDRCQGDSCDNPIPVTDRIEVISSTRILSNAHADLPAACNDEDVPATHDGRELVFALPDLRAGDTVAIDTAESLNPHTIALKAACDDVTGCEAFWQGEDRVDWVVPADGSYFVFIENDAATPDFFRFVVEIERE